jgi:3',5'-cyclic-AMP phosphodiesterase
VSKTSSTARRSDWPRSGELWSNDGMIVFAQLSDIHLDLSDRNEERAVRVMRYLESIPGPLDAVLVTGDLADHGLPAEYEQVEKVLTARYPVFTCPGNHDVRSAYREVLLGEPAGEGPVNRAHEAGGARFLMCDSSIPDQADGFLDEETIGWVDATLASGRGPAFVCFHHPPVTLGIPFVDRIRQFGEERLAEVIARHPEVVAVLCGHAHTPAASTFAGIPLIVSPGVVSTAMLPWEVDTVLNYDLPPMVALHVVAEGRLTTHYRVVP